MLTPWRGQPDLPEADAVLIHGYSLYQASLCHACGRPLVECRDSDNEFDVETDVCNASAAIEEWRAGEGKDAPAGTIPYPVLSDGRTPRSSQAQLLAAARLAAADGDE